MSLGLLVATDHFDRMADDIAAGLESRRAQSAHIAKVEHQRDTLREVAERLLADHQRISPHHASLCELCRDAEAAIQQAAAASPLRPGMLAHNPPSNKAP